MLSSLLIVVGIVLLVLGGEALVRGALGFANACKVSPLLSGLIIVGFGTSMPEMVVSVGAAVDAKPGIALGNVVGSNIANSLLVLGLCAMIYPLLLVSPSLRRDAAVVVGASTLFIVLGWLGLLNVTGGVVLVLTLVGYIGWVIRAERQKQTTGNDLYADEAAEIHVIPTSIGLAAMLSLLGLGLLIGGSQVMLFGALGIAKLMGLSEAFVGLTLVAVGTSLPEITISVIATLRRHLDVAIGNVLGSNLFNLLGIIGVSTLVAPLELPGRIAMFDQWFMLFVATIVFLLVYSGRGFSRRTGCLLFASYIGYLTIGYYYP